MRIGRRASDGGFIGLPSGSARSIPYVNVKVNVLDNQAPAKIRPASDPARPRSRPEPQVSSGAAFAAPNGPTCRYHLPKTPGFPAVTDLPQTAILLAAGSARRLGHLTRQQPKCLLEVGGRSLIEHQVDALRRAGIEEIVVVTGHDADAVRAALGDRSVSFVHNDRHGEGMGSSIAAGIATVADADAVLICLGDMPDIPPVVIETMIATLESDTSIVVPVQDGRRGHPVLFGSAWLLELCALTGDRGARDLLDREAPHLTLVACEDPGVHRDIDTPRDL